MLDNCVNWESEREMWTLCALNFSLLQNILEGLDEEMKQVAEVDISWMALGDNHEVIGYWLLGVIHLLFYF